jgi:hypothetical protein
MPFTKYFTRTVQLFRLYFKTPRLADNFTRSSDKLYVSRTLQTPDIFVSVVRKNTLVSWNSLFPFNGTTLSIMGWIMKLRMSMYRTHRSRSTGRTNGTYTSQSAVWDTTLVTYKVLVQFGRLLIVPLS